MVKRLSLIIFLALLASRSFAITITSFLPAKGQVGRLVTIAGTGLNNPTSLSIGGQSAIVISNTGTQLVAMVMPGAVSGAVSVTNASGTAIAAGEFTVLPTLLPTQQQGNKLVGSNVTGNMAAQGLAVAISADGNTAVIGGYMDADTIGCTYIFVRSGITWAQQGGKLVANDRNTTFYSGQGNAVAISADGNTVIVGGPQDGGTGAAWIFTRAGTTWTQQGAKLRGSDASTFSTQGSAVAISADGNTAVVGSPDDENQRGSFWVYARTGNTWNQVGTKLVGAGVDGCAGNALAISADGNTIVCGGYLDNNYLGCISIFIRSGNTWVQQDGKLVGTSNSPFQYQAQGMSVAISADGNTVIAGAGANGGNHGGSFVFTRTGSTWAQQGPELTQLSGNWEGVSTALSADGTVAYVGADGANNYQGTTFIYTRANGVWSYKQSLLGTGGSIDATQGSSIGYSADGTTVIIGGVGDNNLIGASWIFVEPSPVPVAITLPATNITATGATLNGTVNDMGSATTVTIEYSTAADLSGATTATLTTGTNPVPANTGTVTFASVISGLTPGTTYYFRINGTNLYGTANGSILSFKTLQLEAITFPPLPTVTYGNADLPAGATSTNSTIPITYISSNTSVATVTTAGLIHIVGIGNVTITASQAGNATYSPAVPVSQTLTILPATLIVKANDQTRAYLAADPNLTSTVSGFVYGEKVAKLTSLPTVGSTATAASHPGIYTLTAFGGAAPNYIFTYVPGVFTITKLPQIITFNGIATQKLTSRGITLNPVASSGLPVTLSSANTGVASVSGFTVSFNSAGTTTLTASQPGDIDYDAATATQVLTIVANIYFPNTFTPNNDNVNDTWTIQNIAGYTGCTVGIYSREGRLLYSSIGYGTPWDGKYKGKPVPAGTYYYIIDLKDGTAPISGWLSLIR